MISTCVLFEEVEAVDEFFIFDFGVCEVVPHADKSLHPYQFLDLLVEHQILGLPLLFQAIVIMGSKWLKAYRKLTLS
jgi:hypothetical protein